jgi:isoquinoline 1-oxidoreductase beta subunit
MSLPNLPEHPIERREFLQRLAVGGLVIAVSTTACRRLEEAFKGDEPADPKASFSPAAYVKVDGTGAVTVICHRSEMGQGVRTSVAMAVADELEADWSKVRVEQAPGDEKTYGSQNTDGSRSIRDFLPALREAGASARMMLESAAAARWKVPVGEVRARNHEVVHTPSGRTLPYASLVAAAKDLPVPAKGAVRLKSPAEFRYIGKEVPGVDLVSMTTGRAGYGIDARRDGMRIAVIARPPVYGGKLDALDSADAEKVPGVEKIVRLDTSPPPSGFMPLGGVAVVAKNTWAALQGREKLRLTWTDGPNAGYDSASYRAQLQSTARKPGKVARDQGNVTGALAGAAKRLTADYYIPHLAHAQMEPLAALAVVENGKCEIWAPTQNPQGARDTVAKALGMSTDDVKVNVTLLGGGFGRKSKPDYIVEAAVLAREMKAPVKVIWTRDDDVRHDYYHTVALEHMEGGLDRDGKVTAWLHRSVLPSIGSTFMPNVLYQGDSEMGQGVTDLPYAIPNLRAEAGPAPAHVRIGWYRSVINIPHAFAIHSFVDELAHASGRDTRDFILELLGPDRTLDATQMGLAAKLWNYDQSTEEFPIDVARYKRVLSVATEAAGWGRALPKGRGLGVAVHRSFLSYVATVIEVAVGEDGALTIPRVDVAVDAGLIVHPERVRAQMEGATMMGLGNAMHGEITFERGRVVQSNYTDYKVLRMNEAPRELHVHIVPSEHRSTGIGEPGVPPVAPALANAIFAATGKRIRNLPLAAQLGGEPATPVRAAT